MPVPASDAIASDIGHGALGLRDGLRPLTELLDASAGQRHVWVEARAGKLLTGWTAHNPTGTWALVVDESFDGRRLDVVGVRCGNEALTRVQTVAACEATEGSFFYEAEPGAGILWDSGLTTWDTSTTWDVGPSLYVHRVGGRPPTEIDVLGQFGIFWGSHGVWQPSMSATLLTDGGLEIWSDVHDLTYWTEAAVGAGGGAVNRDATDRAVGAYSCRIDGSLNASGGRGIWQGSLSGVGGATYRIAGYYRSAEDNPAEVEARFRVGYAGAYLQADGRTTTAGTAGITLARTAGYWRRFAFDFVCPGDTAALEVLVFAYNTAAGALTGSVWFDDLTLQRIHRYEFYEPRLSADGVPSVDQGRPGASAWWEPMQTALGQLSIANGNGLLEQLFAAYEWIGAEVVLRIGGRFQDGGNEILQDALFTVFVGIAEDPEVSDTVVRLSLSDSRVALQRRLPARLNEDGTYRPIVLGFGTTSGTQGIVAKRIGLTPNGYGVYDVVDCQDWPPGLSTYGVDGGVNPGVVMTVNAYADEEAARNIDATRGYLLIGQPAGGPLDYSFDFQTGRLTILRDVQPIPITQENNAADFNIGGGALVAKLSTDPNWNWALRSPAGGTRGLVNDLGNAMTAAAGTAIGVAYDQASHKFTISKAGGTLTLLCKTGANAATSIWSLLGFDCSSDKTGATSYTAEDAIFSGPDQHIIRVAPTGYVDDEIGTFTGSTNPLTNGIEKGADQLHFLLRILAGIAASQIDAASFIAARASGYYPALVLTSELTIADVVSWYEATMNADLQLDGGVYFLRVRDTSVPSDVLALQDRDYLSFLASYRAQDYARKVRILYHSRPETGERLAIEEEVTGSSLRLSAPEALDVPTVFGMASPPLRTRLNAIVAEAATSRRRFAITVAGRALALPVGAKVVLTRSKGLSTSGALSAILCRIVAKRDNWAAWTSDLELIEVV